MNRRELLAAAGAAPAAAAGAEAAFEWAEASFADLAAAQAGARTTSRALVEAYLSRIARVDAAGPRLASVIELNPDALAIAAERDRERAAGRVRGPLHGLPVLVKDNIASGDRMLTTAGSPALAAAPAAADAVLVARLREAGAVLLGKTNLSEWANFRGRFSVSGWSTRGGQTLNPYALDRSPSGSSSGSGSAAAANLCAAAVGTETDGSITSPASVMGLVGVKPTLGLVSGEGIVPLAPSQDCAGPMARTVADAALLLAAMAEPGAAGAAALARLPEGALRGVRLGVCDDLLDGHTPATLARFDDALKALQGAGALIVRAPLGNLAAIAARELDVLQLELRSAMPRYLARYAAAQPHRTLADLIAYNRAHPETLALFGQEWFEQAESRGASAAALREALAHGRREARTRGIDRALRVHRVQALLAPTTGPAWPLDPVNGDPLMTPSATTPAAVAGYPHVTVPMGQVAGLPVGLSLFAGAGHDARLLAFAADFERATRHRRAPGFAPRAVR